MFAGRVGRPHGLDGSFHVVDAVPQLLTAGTPLTVDGRATEIVRRAGGDERPVVRVALATDRTAIEALRGAALDVAREHAPPLGEDEYWSEDLVGASVVAGTRELGVVRRLVPLPSCEALELDSGLLVPLVRDAVREVDVAGRRIDVDAEFLGAA